MLCVPALNTGKYLPECRIRKRATVALVCNSIGYGYNSYIVK